MRMKIVDQISGRILGDDTNFVFSDYSKLIFVSKNLLLSYHGGKAGKRLVLFNLKEKKSYLIGSIEAILDIVNDGNGEELISLRRVQKLN